MLCCREHAPKHRSCDEGPVHPARNDPSHIRQHKHAASIDIYLQLLQTDEVVRVRIGADRAGRNSEYTLQKTSYGHLSGNAPMEKNHARY